MSKKVAKAVRLGEAERLYLTASENRQRSDIPWLETLRGGATKAFSKSGLPHRRVEAFKYTDIRNFDRKGFAPAELGEDTSTNLKPSFDGFNEIVVSNGQVVASTLKNIDFGPLEVLSLVDALRTKPQILQEVLGKALLVPNPMADLNMSLMNDGVVIIAPKGAIHERPIHIRYVTDFEAPGAAFVLNVVVAGEGSAFTLIESREDLNPAPSSLNAVTRLHQDKGSSIDHYRFDETDEESMTFMLLGTDLGEETKLTSVSLSLGGKAARLETQVCFAGVGAYANLSGVLIGDDRDHIDHTTYVRHDVPECSCDENFRSILTGNAQGVFQGQISVAPDAQKTDGRMMSRGLLLSEGASMRAKPELEIYADDVKCAHGATVGNLDADALFYMMSRGIPEKDARSLMVEAFSKDVVDAISNDAVRDEFERKLGAKLSRIL
jgi:Fe-S cluster assembly protein SufD